MVERGGRRRGPSYQNVQISIANLSRGKLIFGVPSQTGVARRVSGFPFLVNSAIAGEARHGRHIQRRSGVVLGRDGRGYVYYGGLKLAVVPKVSDPARTGNVAAHVCVGVQEGLEDDPGTEGIGSSGIRL